MGVPCASACTTVYRVCLSSLLERFDDDTPQVSLLFGSIRFWAELNKLADRVSLLRVAAGPGRAGPMFSPFSSRCLGIGKINEVLRPGLVCCSCDPASCAVCTSNNNQNRHLSCTTRFVLPGSSEGMYNAIDNCCL